MLLLVLCFQGDGTKYILMGTQQQTCSVFYQITCFSYISMYYEFNEKLGVTGQRYGEYYPFRFLNFSRIGAKLWNEIPTKLRALPKATFKKEIKMILSNLLENEDSYKDLESIISKVNFYSS